MRILLSLIMGALLASCGTTAELPQPVVPDSPDNLASAPEESAFFDTPVEGDVVPWTHLDFYNDPHHFQFAIVSDRTGGNRPGIFDDAVGKLNLMMPEFVMSVGDLIEGYSRDQAQLDTEWDEFFGLIGELKPPFFYLPGNHDISNDVMREDWERRFGQRYYHFTYKDVLFIAMDTNDGDGVSISDEQVAYVTDALAANPEVRWTFLFLHHPIWQYANNASFKQIEAVLEGRQYTVFAGHTHHYMHRVRNKNNYFVLATTGGGSQLRGPRFGEYDHITWITMSENGPVMANLKLDGIIPYDIVNEESNQLARALLNTVNVDPLLLCDETASAGTCTMYLNISNAAELPVDIEAAFYHHHQVNVDQPKWSATIPPQGAQQFAIQVTPHKAVDADALEPLALGWTMGYNDETYGDIELDGQFQIPLQPSPTENLTPTIPLFVDQVDVTMNDTPEDLTWRYTLDGTEPGLTSPVYDQSLTVTEETTVKARLFNQQGQATMTEEKTYTPTQLRAAVTLDNPKEGLTYAYYEGAWKMLPDFDTLEPIRTGVAKDFNVGEMADVFDHFGFVFEGYVEVPRDGLYEFSTRSDDGSKLFIHDQLVVDNDGSHSTRLRSGAIALEKGLHPVKILYFEDFDGERLIVGYRMTARQRWVRLLMDSFVHE